MKKLWCLEGEKIWEKNSDGILQFFFLEMKWREWREFKRKRERDFSGQSEVAISPTPWGARGPHATREVLWPWVPRLPHGLGSVAFGHALLSRAPSRSSAVSWASELRFQIHFWITNRDSLTHDADYTTLKNG